MVSSPVSPVRLLVFDLDGTLIDSRKDLCEAVNAMLRHIGRPALPEPVIAGHIGDGVGMLVRRCLGDPDDEQTFQTALDYFLEYYRHHKLDHTYVYDGVLDSLAALRAQFPALPMAILTNKPVYPSREICEALQLAPYFFQNYGGNSFHTKKPDPTGLLTLMDEATKLLQQADPTATPILPRETILIGDSDVDVLTARNAGARVLGCSFGLAPDRLAEAGPDATVAHAAEWPEALAALGLTRSSQLL